MRWLVVIAAALCFCPHASAATLHAGDLVVAAANEGGVIYRVRPVNGEEETVAQLRDAVVDIGVVMDTEGAIFVAYGETSRTGIVARVNPVKGTVKILTRGNFLVDPVGIATARDGDLLVVDAEAFGGAGGIVRVNSRSGLQQTIASAVNFGQPQNIAVASNGNLFVTDPTASGGPAVIRVGITSDLRMNDSGTATNPTVLRVKTTKGAQTIVASGRNLRAPVGIALAATGDLIVSDARATGTGAIIRIDPRTGEQRVVCSGGDFGEPQGITVGQQDDLFVADRRAFKERGGIIRVNLGSGTQTAHYPGWRYNDPRSIAIVPASQPDLHIRKGWDFGYYGNDRYNDDGKDQTRMQTASAGETRMFSLRLQNDGKFTDSFVLNGRTRAPGFELKYFLGGGREKELSSDVTAEGEMIHLLRDLAPDARQVVRVEITLNNQAKAGTEEAFLFTASSVNDRTKRDVVKAIVQVKP